jgi:hypothetical protein
MNPEAISSVAALLDSRARAYPDRVAYRYVGETSGPRELTYAQLQRAAFAYAARLREGGHQGERGAPALPPGPRVHPGLLRLHGGGRRGGARAAPEPPQAEALPGSAGLHRGERLAHLGLDHQRGSVCNSSCAGGEPRLRRDPVAGHRHRRAPGRRPPGLGGGGPQRGGPDPVHLGLHLGPEGRGPDPPERAAQRGLLRRGVGSRPRLGGGELAPRLPRPRAPLRDHHPDVGRVPGRADVAHRGDPAALCLAGDPQHLPGHPQRRAQLHL